MECSIRGCKAKDIEYILYDWKNMGFTKRTLHYLNQYVKDYKSFISYAHARERRRMQDNTY